MKKDQATGNNTDKAIATPGTEKPAKQSPPENDNFISEKDEVKYAENKLREHIKKQTS